jgi:hypothetical protein
VNVSKERLGSPAILSLVLDRVQRSLTPDGSVASEAASLSGAGCQQFGDHRFELVALGSLLLGRTLKLTAGASGTRVFMAASPN